MKKILKYSKLVVCIAVIFFAATAAKETYDWPGFIQYVWWDNLFEKLLKPAALVKEGDVAPDFTLKDLNGKEWTLSKLRSKPVLLVFWSRH